MRKAIVAHGVCTHSFYKHLDTTPAAAEQYARAKEAQIEALADEMLEIADNPTGDVYADDEGGMRLAPDVVQRSRLRVDTRKWLLSKLAPKKYGDKVDIEHTGAVAFTIASSDANL